MTTANAPRRLALYRYQEDAFKAVFEAEGRGVTRQIVSLPTGGGKTVLAAHLIGGRRPAVFMCHRDELVSQTIDKLHSFDPSLNVAVCKADRGRHAWELEGFDVVIASAQTLAREARLAELQKAIPELPLLIVDEAHHSAAATWTRTIETLSPRLLVGLTATPKRGDGIGLDGLFQEIVYSLPMRDLVEVGKLARPIGLRVGTSVDLGAVHTRGGEFVESELSTIINTPQRNGLVVDAWEKHIRDGGCKRTIAFCVDVAHANDLYATFLARGHVADVVTGATPTDERARMYRDLKSGVLPVLISVMVLTEGFDEPLVDSALMCRPTQSQALYIQMAGRALRQAEGKPDALIVDFVDVTARHNLQTILTLAGDAPVEEPEEGPLDLFAGVDAAEVKLAQAESRKARIRSGAELLGDLLGVAPVVWQRDGDRWFASTGAKAWISVIPFDGGFAPIRVGDDGFEFLFDRSVDAQTAMNIAQAAIPKNTLTKRDADWRNGLASEKQLRILRLPPDTYMSRGEASERIDRKFFARAFKESGAVEIEETA